MSFAEISKQTCGEVYPIVRRNAERHFRTSKVLGGAKEYPNAIAHLILGTEELIKSFMLLLESKDFRLREVKGYKKLFYNHSSRHSIIKEFFSVWVFFRHMLDTKKRKKGESKCVYWLGIATTVLHGLVNSVSNYEWWEKADRLKQNCFYVDYLDQIHSPGIIDDHKYLEAENHVKRFYKDIRILMMILSKANEQEMQEFRRLYKETDIKNLLEESLERSTIKQ